MRRWLTASCGVCVAALVWLVPMAARQAAVPDAAPPLRFVAHTIDTGLRGGYQTVVTDLNRDARPDIIALASGLTELVWYENPAWRRHVIARDLRGMINVAASDLDGDGIPELALAHGFATSVARSEGIVSLLEHVGDPREPWSIRELDRTPTAHRLRWAHEDGGAILVNAPLIGPDAVEPDYRDRHAIFWYRPPDWRRRTVTDAEDGVVHGLEVAPWGSPERDALLTAGFLGVHLHERGPDGWTRTRLTAGDPSPWPTSGASEIAVGHLDGERFLATIEPWHGHRVVVYRASEADGTWAPGVVDTTIEDGHTLVVADLDGDGRDEIVVGERRGRRSVYLYQFTGARPEPWVRQVVDAGGMAAAGCAVADLDADAGLDLVCIGTATANLKWYAQTSANPSPNP
jgi:hypothetical protein